MFYVGQMVVCVDDTADFHEILRKTDTTLKRGNIYTIRKIDRFAFADNEDALGVWLEEVVRFNDLRWDLPYGLERRFRPVKHTSIDCFTALLAPTPKQQVTA